MLSIRELVKIYPGPVAALQGIHLDVPTGMFGLLGPNGAGKTTLMRILAGLLEPTSGSASLDGEDILDDPSKVWRRLGYLPQDFGFYPHLSGEKMLAHLLELKGIEAADGNRKKLVADLLERVNLTAAAGRKVSTYSGGMRQRLGIAQAIAGNPRLIIVDEPTAGLDPEERLRFYRLLAELAEDRIVLLSTHIVEDVAVLCPQLAVIRKGRLLTSTRPAEARAAVAGRVFEAMVDRGDLEEVHRRYQVTQSILFEGRHKVRIFQPDGVAPLGFSAVQANLEDAYLVLMQDPAGRLPSVPGDAGGPAEEASKGEPTAVSNPEVTASEEEPVPAEVRS
ncbi:MAG: ABC transporter ATP-binding protein [Acidobacteriota bacterium]|nr:ABC transporter ATP-binding protein [Acidobacteriota bacterium]